ncbi:hypothetical protein GCM10010909_36550 [Acidocella aquatica]|uniref:Uncharacterized protein n=1 Tax=Acidocella aquatica TaxID=1922313 RepID=A0ABQ6AFH8_9PROT|nr:hypothetical protein [Acidocella aquatica]GLR68973.1 hypothetical protein GCM10010909_36550 [Acidocella aquatica]
MADIDDPAAIATGEASAGVAFDEETYLRLNPDVRLAVASGGFHSGRDHYERYGRAEGRPFMMPQGGVRGRIVMTAAPDTRREKVRLPAAAVDAVRLSRSGGIFVVGWINDVSDRLDSLDLYFSNWSVSLDANSLARERREDAEEALANGGRHPYGWWGFMFAARRLPAGVCSVVLRLKSGTELSFMVTAEMLEDQEMRKATLTHLVQAKYFGNPYFDAVAAIDATIGEQMADFNKMLSRRAVNAPYAERFGETGRSYKGSIIVCLYGKAEYMFLQQALFSRLAGIHDYEFIYVLNSPWIAEQTLREAKRCALIYGLDMSVVILNSNAGFGAANNAAAQFASSDRLLIMNPDVFPYDSNWAEKHTMLIETLPHEQTALFGAPLYYDDGSLMHAGMYFCEDTMPGFAGGRKRETSILRVEHYGKGAPPETAAFLKPRPVPAVTGAFMSVQRAWFEQLGGFTQDYVFGHYEDADLCLKSIEAGCLPWLHDIRLWHLEGKGSARRPQHEGGSVVNRWLFSRSWGEMVRNSLLGPQPGYAGLGGEAAS